MTTTRREMALVAFLQAQNCSNYVGSWRHPASAIDFTTAEYYQRIGRAVEHGKFHLAFFDDRLAMPDMLNNDYREAVRHGVRVVKMDLIPLLTAIGMATRHVGLGGTYSTTYYEPYHVARVFATLDLMIDGRAAWNVVTSLNNSEALNFGREATPDHDLRYDIADEFMEVVLGHWDTWEDGSIVMDKASGLFADPDKIHQLNFSGKHFRSKGPFTVPRSRQGRPVIIQAGQSGRGRAFAARWAELVFAIFANIDIAKRTYKDLKAQVAGFGRDPANVRLTPACYVVVGETKTIAEDKRATIAAQSRMVDQLALLSEALNFDFGSKALDEPFTQAELDGIMGLRAVLDRVVHLSGKQNPTLDDFVKFSNRGTINELPVFCGTPKDVADQMEEWFVGEACDGFVIAAPVIPGAYEDFARLVTPELQRRGLLHREYAGSTLRENLGFPKAQRGDWRTKP